MTRLVALLIAVSAALAGCDREAAAVPDAERVLIVSLPGVGWEDVERLDLENLAAFADDAAVGHVATRIGRGESGAEAAYLTIGAGTRAVAPRGAAGAAIGPDEVYLGTPAREVLARRLGEVPGGAGYLPIASALERNRRSAFGADVGALGDALEAAGVDRAVVANADTSLSPERAGSLHREAAAALVTSSGSVPSGTVSSRLLASDRDAPFGVRLDHQRVLEAFDEAWDEGGRQVVLVEASDLRRARDYRGVASPGVAAAMRDRALVDADRLLGQLLERTTDDDAVLVVSPVAPTGAADLGVVAWRPAGGDDGRLRSATTRRTGFVHLADIAPTVLAALGEEMPGAIEGRPFEVVDEPDAPRPSALAAVADAAHFRDAHLPAIVVAVVALLAALAAATAFTLRTARDNAAPALRGGAFVMLGVVPGTFLAHAVLPDPPTLPAYAAVVLLIAGAVGVISMLVDRRWRGSGLIVAVGSGVAVIAGDVLSGAHLQVNAVFGYSVAVAGRFAGLGNLAFALLSAGAVVLAVLVAERWGRSGRRAAVAILAAVVLVDGLPTLGADVGGTLSVVPAFGLTILLLRGSRLRPAHAALLAAAAFAAVFAAAFVDLARPAGVRTHLARLAEHLAGGRWDRLVDTVVRRWGASFGGGELGAWVLVAVLAALTAAYVALVALPTLAPGLAQRLRPPERAAGAGLLVLAVLGLAANDSSFAVPATMLIVVVPVVVARSLAPTNRGEP